MYNIELNKNTKLTDIINCSFNHLNNKLTTQNHQIPIETNL